MFAEMIELERRQLLSQTLAISAADSVITPGITSKAPASIILGQKLSASESITLTNSSGSNLTGSFGAKLYLSDQTSLDTSSILLPESYSKSTTLKTGKMLKATLKITSLPTSVPSGQYYFVAQSTDPSGGTMTAASTSQIDVETPEVDVTGSFASTPGPATEGKKLKVSLSLTEAGNIPVTSLDILFELSVDGNSNPFQLANVVAKAKLEPNKPAVVSLSVPIALGGPTGQQYLIAVLDPRDVLNDVNLSNNVFHTINPITFSG
jgi:hypothetical protein